MGHKKLTHIDRTKDYPDFLKKVNKQITSSEDSLQPTVIKMDEADAESRLKAIAEGNPELTLVDNYDEQYAELLLSRNAHLYRANHDVQVASISDLLKKHYGEKKPWRCGAWVHFPWSNKLIHILEQQDFEDLRTIRNRDLITHKEQLNLFDFSMACFGMSVGSAGAQVAALTGVSRRIKLIDGAVISGSNLNRMMTGVQSVGKKKAQTIAEQIYEMNPYSAIACFDKVTHENIDSIFEHPWPTNLAIDEIDDIEMKVHIRKHARARRIPVVMATEIGDTVILDVERFDQEPKRPFFHGRTPEVEDLLERDIRDYREWTKHAVDIIDPSNMSVKMQESLLKIGSSVVTHPQLGSTVMMTGGVLAFAAKHIALGNELQSGRYVISLENQTLASHRTRKYKQKHKKHTKVIKKAVKSMQ